ncbi:hypothetical protein F2P56_023464 [Juglans regia]|uniref:Retrotransposon Copia-like N-terminal domain-containing protein n=1 Tax=Juglans regia TaxID=51240 RepID=A0A833USE1_JUGRE|nr:hypothetical protein F2P56_023464 [Juglans regia]
MTSSMSNSGPPPIFNPKNTNPLSLIAINTTSQLPIKLTATNFPSWRAHFTSLLIGHDLRGFVDGSLPCPPRATDSSSSTNTPSMSPAYLHWYHQDKLLLSAIFSSVSENVMPLIAIADTSREARDTLARLFTNRSRTRVMQLKETLTLLHGGSRSVSEFLQSIKATADELALINTPLTNDDFTLLCP